MISPNLPSRVAHVECRRYQRGDLRGFSLVVSATGDARVNDVITEEAASDGVWLNVVDDPDRSTFFFTALHREGEVTVSVSTNGRRARPRAVRAGPRRRGAARRDSPAWPTTCDASDVDFTTTD